MLLFKQPKDHPLLSDEERQLILDRPARRSRQSAAADAAQLLRMRETWGCVLVRALTDPISYFLLFWIPLYFQKQYGFDLQQVGMFLWIPYAVAALGNLFGGAIPRLPHRARLGVGPGAQEHDEPDDRHAAGLSLFRRRGPVTRALALLWWRGMTFCHGGWSNITLPAEVFPKTPIATVTGSGRRARLLGGRTGAC